MNISEELTIGDICQKLRKLRNSQGLSLADVEIRSGGRLKAVVLGSYERGARALSVKRALEIAHLYGIPASELFQENLTRSTTLAPVRRTFDLRNLKKYCAEQVEFSPIARFISEIQKRRQDWNGEVISLRESDFDLLAIASAVSTDQLDKALDEKGILFVKN